MAVRQRPTRSIVAVDLDGPRDDLVSALQGIDWVMCILPPHCTMQQISLADAALTAKVKRFVPNMWSTPCPPKGVMKIRDCVGDKIQRITKLDPGSRIADECDKKKTL